MTRKQPKSVDWIICRVWTLFSPVPKWHWAFIPCHGFSPLVFCTPEVPVWLHGGYSSYFFGVCVTTALWLDCSLVSLGRESCLRLCGLWPIVWFFFVRNVFVTLLLSHSQVVLCRWAGLCFPAAPVPLQASHCALWLACPWMSPSFWPLKQDKILALLYLSFRITWIWAWPSCLNWISHCF